ncbi:MAG: hypothetical protein RL742_549 [Bacteroidota bacterium]|jgi:hypothetical protein
MYFIKKRKCEGLGIANFSMALIRSHRQSAIVVAVLNLLVYSPASIESFEVARKHTVS